MRVLVTGAAGFIGSHLVDRLLTRGDEVTGVDNFDPFYSPLEKRANLASASGNDRFRLAALDVTDPASVERELGAETFDVVVHLAAKAGVRPSIADPEGYVRANILGTQVVLSAARRLGVRRFVFGSSSSVYGNTSRVPFAEDDAGAGPISPYAATKRSAELLCYTHQHLYGGSILCLRFFTVYGPRQRPDLAIRKFSELMVAGRPLPLFGAGKGGRDYTWVDDTVTGIVAGIDRGGVHTNEFQIINLGGNRVTDLRTLVKLLGDALGLRPAVEDLPPQPGDVEQTFADISKASRLLGYAPAIPIEEGIPRFVAWFKGRRPGL